MRRPETPEQRRRRVTRERKRMTARAVNHAAYNAMPWPQELLPKFAILQQYPSGSPPRPDGEKWYAMPIPRGGPGTDYWYIGSAGVRVAP